MGDEVKMRKWLVIFLIAGCGSIDFPDRPVRYESRMISKCSKPVTVHADMKATWHASDFRQVCKLDVAGFRTSYVGVMQSKHDPACGFFYPGHLVTLDNFEMKLEAREYLECF